MLPFDSYFPRLRATSLPLGSQPPSTPRPTPNLSPSGTPPAGRPPTLARRSFSGLSKLFSLAAESDDGTPGGEGSPGRLGSSSTLATPPQASTSQFQFSSTGTDCLGPPALVRSSEKTVAFPREVDEGKGKGKARRNGEAGPSARAAQVGLGGEPQKVNSKKVRIAIRLMEELEKEALTQDLGDELEEDYVAHLLTLSLTSALSSVPPAVQNRVFTQSPQLYHLPHPGLRFDFGDEDWGWKERAADGLGKGMVWAWVTGLPILLQVFTVIATVFGVIQGILIRLRVMEAIEYYAIVFLRYLATSPAFEQLRNVGADVTWVAIESIRRGLGGVMVAQQQQQQQQQTEGFGGNGRQGRR